MAAFVHRFLSQGGQSQTENLYGRLLKFEGKKLMLKEHTRRGVGIRTSNIRIEGLYYFILFVIILHLEVKAIGGTV